METTIILGIIAAFYVAGCVATFNYTAKSWEKTMREYDMRYPLDVQPWMRRAASLVGRWVLILGWPLFETYDHVMGFWSGPAR